MVSNCSFIVAAGVIVPLFLHFLVNEVKVDELKLLNTMVEQKGQITSLLKTVVEQTSTQSMTSIPSKELITKSTEQQTIPSAMLMMDSFDQNN